MVQPVGHVLRRDTQRCAVFHEANVVDIRDLGAADAQVDPANDVAQNGLQVVAQLSLDLLRRERLCYGVVANELGFACTKLSMD